MIRPDDHEYWIVPDLVPSIKAIKWQVYDLIEIEDKVDWLHSRLFELKRALKSHPMHKEVIKEIIEFIESDLDRWKELERLQSIPASTPSEQSEEIDIDEVARMTGYAVGTLRHMCSRKYKGQSIPHYKRGRRVYFLRTEIREWMTENRVQTKEEQRSEELLKKIVAQREGRE